MKKYEATMPERGAMRLSIKSLKRLVCRRSACAGLLAAALLSLSVSAWAASRSGKVEVDPVLVAGQRLTLPSKMLGEQREILVHLPQNYAKSKQRYPVLFVLDGNNHFAYGAGIVDFLADNNKIPELILVAVPAMRRRARDLTMPLTLDKKAMEDIKPHQRVGGAERFLGFLADELVPWIDARYRTQPYRILSGHSLGGLFNFYALLQRPDAFQAHIAVSPSLWWDERAWVRQAKEDLDGLAGRHWLYFSWGDWEPTIRDSSQELVDWMRGREFAGLEWKSRYYPGDDHGTTPLRSLYDGLEWLYDGWRMKRRNTDKMEFAEVQRHIHDHYAALSQRYGYTIEPSADAREVISGWLLRKERYEEALAEARANLAAHPEEDWLHERISDILDKQGNATEALAEYKHALSGRALPEAGDGEYGNVWDDEHRLDELKRKAAGRGDADGGASSH